MINGSYLRQLRLSRNCTLKQASAAAGCTASFISQVERGLKEPSLSTLRNLADFFGVSLVSFFQTTQKISQVSEGRKSLCLLLPLESE